MDNLAGLKAEVFSKQKILAKIYQESAQKSLADYIAGWPVLLPSENTRIFFAQAQKLLLQIYSSKVAEGVLKEALLNPLVSTVDHHGILNHPFFVNSRIILQEQI